MRECFAQKKTENHQRPGDRRLRCRLLSPPGNGTSNGLGVDWFLVVDSLGRGLGTVLGTTLGAANGAALEPTRAMEPIRPKSRATPHPSTNNAMQTTANIAKCLPSFSEI